MDILPLLYQTKIKLILKINITFKLFNLIIQIFKIKDTSKL